MGDFLLLQINIQLYLRQIKQMNNFGLFNNMYYQFWLVPNYVNNRPAYYNTMPFYPQLFQPQASNLIVQNQFPPINSNLQIQQQKTEPKIQPKIIRQQPKQKSETEKITVQTDQTISKDFTNKIEPKKANRPQTYLTEKAYYMKQKLKGKQINGSRILRRRIKPKQSKFNKVENQQKKVKKSRETVKIIAKKLPIAKDSEKERKILIKIRNKIAKQYCQQFAQIPKLISGVVQLNQFCKRKLDSLMLRRIKEQ